MSYSRTPHYLVVATLAAVALSACSIGRSQPDIPAPRSQERANIAAVERARTTLDSLFRSGERSGAESLLAPDLRIEGGPGQALTGRGAVWRAVASTALDGRLDLVTARQKTEGCVGGAMEKGSYSVFVEAGDGSRTMLTSGRYAALWEVDERGEASLKRVVTGSNPAAVERASGCRTLAREVFESRRVTVAVTPVSAYVNSDVETQLRGIAAGHGWNQARTPDSRHPVPTAARDMMKPFEGFQAPIGANVRVRWDTFSMEAGAILGVKGAVFAFNPDWWTGLIQGYRMNEYYTILSLRRGPWRAGAGPALASTAWTAREIWVWNENSDGPKPHTPPPERKASTSSVGAAAQVGYSHRLGGSAFLDATARFSSFGNTAVDSQWVYPGGGVKPKLKTVGVSLGWAF